MDALLQGKKCAESSNLSWEMQNPYENDLIDIISAPEIKILDDEIPLSAVKVLNLFLNPLLETVQRETERAFCMRKKNSRLDQFWVSVVSEDYRKYVGIIIMMGIDRKPAADMHWQTHGMWSSNLINSTMSRDKFRLIGTYLSIGIPNQNDKLARVRELSELINKLSVKYYKPRSNLTIDESMIAYKGKHGLKQYIPMKPTKWGFKAFLLCESTTGYCYKHLFYGGPGLEEFRPIRICHHLCEGLDNKGIHIYADNYYSSVRLAEELLEKNIYFTGTIRQTSKGLPNLKEILKDLRPNEKLYFQKKNITVYLWRDKKTVKLISNYFGPRIDISSPKNLPLALTSYRKFMSGVDKFDQSLQYYAYPHKFKKWWKFFFVYLIEIVIYNSFIIYSEICECNSSKKMTYIEFRLEIARSLTYFQANNEFHERSSDDNEENHERIVKEKCGKCKYCLIKDIRSNSTYMCSICQVYLHKSCFEEYHKPR